MKEFTITASQCRGARAMLGWSRAILAKKSRVSERTVTDFERGARTPIASTKLAIKTAFENAGIEFIDENGGGPGVRLNRKRPAAGN
ncbi:MAG: helix-turn-helix domain-containing protein [Sphingomonadales bacterium]|nr:helix-turn-helix domain-containing protein [Sphingomonadales bacterium]